MWQHAANIVIGLLLTTAVFITTGLDLLNSSLFWWLAGTGLVVAALALWGLLDEIIYESAKSGA
jgi:protein-S-isoprenylcysteine O-methyltransferase Ste14